MKIKGHGQARVLTNCEIERLFLWGFKNIRDRTLFAICLHTGCRISEALAVKMQDISGGYLNLRKSNTKGHKQTRSIPVNDKLNALLTEYIRQTKPELWLFPSHHNSKTSKQMSRAAADLILRKACERVGLVGVSTHSFRRTALTQMSSAGIPLRVIQKISGHSSLATLQRYLEISDQQVVEAVNVIGSKAEPASMKRSEFYQFPF